MYRSASVSGPPAWARVLPVSAGAVVVLVGFVVLAGWHSGEMSLTHWSGYGASMKANTALLAILCGIWLLIPGDRWRVWSSLALGLPILLIAALTAAEWFTGVSLGIDDLFSPLLGVGAPPGRTSLPMAGAFVCFSLVILTGPIHQGRYLRRLPTSMGMIYLFYALALELFILFNARNLDTQAEDSGIAVASSVVLMALAIGVFGRHATRRPHRWLWESGLAGSFSRRMVPVSLLLPTVLGTIELVLIELGVLDFRAALALVTALISFSLLLVIADTIRVVARAEQERDQVALELTAIFDSVPAVIAVRDLDGKILRANSVLAEARGAHPSAMVGHTIDDYYPPEFVEILEEQVERIRVSGRAETIDVTTNPVTGGVRQTELTQFPVTDPQGVVIGLGAIGIDVTKRYEAQDAADRATARLKAFLDSAPDATIVVDSLGVITFANEQTTRLLGYASEELIGASVDLLVPLSVRDRHAGLRHRYAASPGRREMGADIALSARHKDGHEIPVEISLGPLETEGEAVTVASIRDVTEKRAAQEIADRATARFKAVLDSAPDATIVVDSAGLITFVNEQTSTLLGYTSDELIGASVDTLVPTSVRDRHAGLRDRYAQSPDRRVMGVDIDLSARHKDGHEIPVEISLGPLEIDGEAVTVAAIRDVTEKRAAQEALQAAEEHYRYLAEHDPLTGLPNRRRFTDALEELVDTTPDSGALLAIDLDRFKTVNDSFGHEAGDRLLVVVAAALQASIRTGDILARVGGDEFLVLCPGCSAEDALGLANRIVGIVQEVADRFGEAGRHVSASVGVVNMIDLEPSDRTPKVALLRADIALYGAKSEGRGRSQVYVPAARSGEQTRDHERS